MALSLRGKPQTDLSRFFHYYRVTAYPFNPILADMDRFESDMCTYLNAHAAGELRGEDRIVDRWASDKSIAHISLLLATLAAGAHYSDIEYPQRLELASDFGEESINVVYKTAAYNSSSTLFPCSPFSQFPFPTKPRYCSDTLDTRQHIAEYGPIGCGMGFVRNHDPARPNDGIAH